MINDQKAYLRDGVSDCILASGIVLNFFDRVFHYNVIEVELGCVDF